MAVSEWPALAVVRRLVTIAAVLRKLHGTPLETPPLGRVVDPRLSVRVDDVAASVSASDASDASARLCEKRARALLPL